MVGAKNGGVNPLRPNSCPAYYNATTWQINYSNPLIYRQKGKTEWINISKKLAYNVDYGSSVGVPARRPAEINPVGDKIGLWKRYNVVVVAYIN